MAIVDSFSKTLSVCKKGLILESGRPVYLPLYPGECNIPLDTDNSTSSSSSSIPTPERAVDEKKQQGGIGPFTKEQNYEAKDGYIEMFVEDKSAQRKGLGPFTKDQNIRIVDSEVTLDATRIFENTENRRSGVAVTNPWMVLDISSDGDSNSLENAYSERGRAFSGSSSLIYHASTSAERETTVASVASTTSTVTTAAAAAATTDATTTTTEFKPDIIEPVLRPSKKEAGRSLKLPEITEPILRATRQNARNEVVHEGQRDEIQETSSTSTFAFTVQFLPERLAGILAQAERYARQTLLPFISQYTPSFVTGMRHDEPKYFPFLGELGQQKNADVSETDGTADRQSDRVVARVDVGGERKDDEWHRLEKRRYENSNARTESSEEGGEHTVPRAEVPVIVEAVYPKITTDSGVNFSGRATATAAETRGENASDWRPIGESSMTTTSKSVSSRRDSNVSRSLDWSVDNSQDWSSRNVNANSETTGKADGWIPIAIKSGDAGPATPSEVTRPMATVTPASATDVERKSAEDRVFLGEVKEESTAQAIAYERKFIPLIDPETTGSSSTTDSNDISESRSTTTPVTHIQKIPRPKEKRVKSARALSKPAMIFPYAYERRNDPRTRYIPLLPEEDMGKPYSFMERDR